LKYQKAANKEIKRDEEIEKNGQKRIFAQKQRNLGFHRSQRKCVKLNDSVYQITYANNENNLK